MTATRSKFRSLLPALAFLLATAAFAPALAGSCATADIGEPFLLPNGHEYPAGKLTLCDNTHLTPATSVHEVRVNGRPVGLYVSGRSRAIESERSSILLVFHRNRNHRLQLFGFADRNGLRNELRSLYDPSLEAERRRVEIAARRG